MEEWESNLSPHIRERLARVGEVTSEEKERMRRSQELNALLSEYFSGKLDSEGLWKTLKGYKDAGQKFAIKEAQARLINTLRLEMSPADFEKHRAALLAIETLKSEGKYPMLELTLNSMESLRQEYTRAKEEAYNQLKNGMEKQLQAAAEQALRQGIKVDVETSLEANIKAHPDWRNFVARLELTYGERFDDYLAQLREII